MDSPTTDDPTPPPAAGSLSTPVLLLFALAVLWVVPLAVCGVKLASPSAATAPSQAEDPDKADKEKEKSLLAATDPNRTSYIVVVVLSALGGITALAAGLWSVTTRDATPPDDHAAGDRKRVLVAGVISGGLLMALGVYFVIDEYELLTNWLTRKDTKTKDLWRVLVPALLFIVGTGQAFLSALPARQDERNSQLARRLVYGTNGVVTGLLLFGALVVLNGFVALRLPNRLDTTASGYYSIDPSTASYVRTLTEKVTVYNFPQQEGATETQHLLAACREANPSQFVVRTYAASISETELRKLQLKFPAVDFGTVALIVALGDDETRYSTIRQTEIVRREGGGMPGEAGKAFYEGETRLVRELLYLSEGKTKSTVYFTQGHGELAVEAGPRRPAATRSAMEVKSFLEKVNLQVKPLPFDPNVGKLPDDASVIVVADPTLPLGKELAAALQKYMTEPGPGGKKGKLIVLSAPHPNAANDGVATTDLEELLKGFNVTLVPRFLFNKPSDQFPPERVVCFTSPTLQQDGNPPASALPSVATDGPWLLGYPRPLEVLPNGNPAIQTTPLIETVGGQTFVTWQEDKPTRDTRAAFAQLVAAAKAGDQASLDKRHVSMNQIPLAAIATEGPTPRLVVVGAGEFFSDAAARGNHPSLGFMSASIDWLRDRPVVAVANKQYGYYTPNARLDKTRLLFLPFGLLALAVVGLAAGVWVVRRK